MSPALKATRNTVIAIAAIVGWLLFLLYSPAKIIIALMCVVGVASLWYGFYRTAILFDRINKSVSKNSSTQ